MADFTGTTNIAVVNSAGVIQSRAEIIFSTEGYSDKSGAKRAIDSIKKHVGDAPVEDAD